MNDSISRLYIPMVAAPFILAVLGFRTSSLIALIGMITALLAVFGWRKWIAPILHTDTSLFPCALVNGITMLTLHYLWKWLNRIRNKAKVKHSLPE